MTTTQVEPRFVVEARIRKADALAHLLRNYGETAADVATYTPEDRRMAEAEAEVKASSDKTWRVVIEMLAGSSNPDALCPFCHRGDPEGDPGPRKAYGHDGPCAQ